ncbi:hypothetical protein BOTBODRAFT_39673 [Botryobasidium botryosum FD-172 SS1]|uniref:Uncharacterized protein n=1 Tax=Botryobasidium botryosum (strain FD-172 SS1) TaxID=930990 RepID=A0A067LTG5_BOTB1|nr:hypothetical protein BOTBODRAFT_39673 [Botryobasidium botryosum FD-172 SS1]
MPTPPSEHTPTLPSEHTPSPPRGHTPTFPNGHAHSSPHDHPVNATSPPEYTMSSPTTPVSPSAPKPLQLTEDQTIDAVFQLIAPYFGSLGLFLIAVFSNAAYNRHRGQFCCAHLLAVVGTLWNCQSGRNCLQPWAFQRIGDVLWKELHKFGKHLAVGYKNITRAFLEIYTIKRVQVARSRHPAFLLPLRGANHACTRRLGRGGSDEEDATSHKDMVCLHVY